MPIEPLLDQPFAVLTEMIAIHAAERGEAVAVIKDDDSLTYAQLDALMDRAAAAMQRDGVRPGQAVAICAKSGLEYAVVFLAALRAGAAAAPLAPSASAQDLAGMIADCGADLLFLDQEAAAAMAPAAEAIAARRIALDGSAAGQAFEAWLAAPGARPQAAPIAPDAPFNIIYSSGTTGAPKGIVHSHAMRWSQLNRAGALGYGPGSVNLCSTPLYSNTTLVSFLPSLMFGGTVVLMDRFDAGGYLVLAQKHRVTHTMLVPVQYRRLLEHPDFAAADLSAFRLKFCTSAPFPAALKAEVLRRWPGGLIEYFGMTEGGGTCVLVAHEFPDKLHTVGRPAPGHDIRLIDEDGVEVAAGETGEIVGASGVMMNGYHGQPAKTAAAEWISPDGRRFIRTGDMGRFDTEGFLTLMDRKKDMIISGGFNIYPSDIEAVICGHEAVAEAAVVGVASDRWGETPAAFIVLKAGSGADVQAVTAWANARLGKTQRLAAAVQMDALPRSAIGKVLKRELRDGFTQKLD